MTKQIEKLNLADLEKLYARLKAHKAEGNHLLVAIGQVLPSTSPYVLELIKSNNAFERADYKIWSAASAEHGVDIEARYYNKRRWPDGRLVSGEAG